MVASFGSALVHGSPWDSRFLLYTTDNARSCNSTYDTLDSWIAWAFAELAAGQWLGHSPWGEVMGQRKSKEGALIADGWRGVLFATGETKRLWLSATMSEQLGSVMKYVSIAVPPAVRVQPTSTLLLGEMHPTEPLNVIWVSSSRTNVAATPGYGFLGSILRWSSTIGYMC